MGTEQTVKCDSCGTELILKDFIEENTCTLCNGITSGFTGLSPYEDYDNEELWECKECGELFEMCPVAGACDKCGNTVREVKCIPLV